MKRLAKPALALFAVVITASPLFAGPPTINSASADPNNTVLTVTGTALSPVDTHHSLLVVLNNMKLNVTSSSSTVFTASLPSGVSPGSYHLYVDTAGSLSDGGHLASLDVTLVAPPPTGGGGGGTPSIIPVISMTWSSSTTAISNPADGLIGCNNSDPTSSSVTQIWSSFKGTDHVDYSSLFNTFSFDVGGYLVIRNVSLANGSPQNILVYPLSRFGYNANVGSGNQTMTCAAASIYLGAGFSDGDAVLVSFLPPAPAP